MIALKKIHTNRKAGHLAIEMVTRIYVDKFILSLSFFPCNSIVIEKVHVRGDVIMKIRNIARALVITICSSSLVVSANALDTNLSTFDYSIYEPRYVSTEEFFARSPELTADQVESIVKNDPDAVRMNEFDVLISLKTEAINSLAENNISISEENYVELQELAAFDPSDRVEELQQLSDNELKRMGFEEERIDIIRNYSGSVEQLRGLGAECTVSISNEKYNKVGDKRWAKMTLSFLWDGVPFWGRNDCLVMGASSTFHAQRVDDTYCKINYTAYGATGSLDFSQSYHKNSLVISPFLATNSGFYFPESIEKINSNGNGIIYHSKSGYATMAFMSVDDRQVTLSGAHGHAVQNVEAAIGIDFSGKSIGGGVSISLSEETYNVEAIAADPYTFPS